MISGKLDCAKLSPRLLRGLGGLCGWACGSFAAQENDENWSRGKERVFGPRAVGVTRFVYLPNHQLGGSEPWVGNLATGYVSPLKTIAQGGPLLTKEQVKSKALHVRLPET